MENDRYIDFPEGFSIIFFLRFTPLGSRNNYLVEKME